MKISKETALRLVAGAVAQQGIDCACVKFYFIPQSSGVMSVQVAYREGRKRREEHYMIGDELVLADIPGDWVVCLGTGT